MTNRIDHTGHDHPATPAGRAACRKGRTAPAPDAPTYIQEHIRKTAANAQMKIRIDARAARAAASARDAATGRLMKKSRKRCGCGNPVVDSITGPNAPGACGPNYCHYALSNGPTC